MLQSHVSIQELFKLKKLKKNAYNGANFSLKKKKREKYHKSDHVPCDEQNQYGRDRRHFPLGYHSRKRDHAELSLMKTQVCRSRRAT